MKPVGNVDKDNTWSCLDMRNHDILMKHAKNCKTVGRVFA